MTIGATNKKKQVSLKTMTAKCSIYYEQDCQAVLKAEYCHWIVAVSCTRKNTHTKINATLIFEHDIHSNVVLKTVKVVMIYNNLKIVANLSIA